MMLLPVLAAAATVFAIFARSRCRRAQQISRFTFALASAFLKFFIGQFESRVFQQAHRYLNSPILVSSNDVGAGDDVRQASLNRFTDFFVVTQPVARATRKQVIPLCLD